MTFDKEYMKTMIGFDDNVIQCPICKTFKNTWQPLLPLGLDSVNDADRLNPVRINYYIDYCSQLITNHYNTPNTGAGQDERQLPTSIMAGDIKKDPENFIMRMCSVVTYMVLENTCMKNNQFLTPFDCQSQQSDVFLREIVFMTITTSEIV